MSRNDPQVNIRLPVELKTHLEGAAEENQRAFKAEIVARLREYDMLLEQTLELARQRHHLEGELEATQTELSQIRSSLHAATEREKLLNQVYDLLGVMNESMDSSRLERRELERLTTFSEGDAVSLEAARDYEEIVGTSPSPGPFETYQARRLSEVTDRRLRLILQVLAQTLFPDEDVAHHEAGILARALSMAHEGGLSDIDRHIAALVADKKAATPEELRAHVLNLLGSSSDDTREKYLAALNRVMPQIFHRRR